MKMKLTKLIALLVSMAMLTSLVACAADDGEEQTDDNDTSNADKYKNLSPEKVYAALLEAEEVRINVECYEEDSGEQYEITGIIERDGNKVKESYSDLDGDKDIEYYDLDNGRNYRYYEEDGAWSVNFGWNLWDDIVEYAFNPMYSFNACFLFDDESYETDGDRYVATTEAINDYIAEERVDEHMDIQIEAYMDREENKYSYVFNVDGLVEGEVQNFKITVEFTDTTVEFPNFGIEIEQDDEGLVYELNDSGTYTVVDIGGTDKTDLVIPSTYKGKAVTAIGDEAFRAAQITSITIPDSIKRIDYEAFERCYNLTSVVFENPEGWTADGESIDLSDPAQAAIYLTDTYVDYAFDRN